MKNSSLYYSVGPLLYCPANSESIAKSIINEKFGDFYSLALCLEDTISDDFLEEAEVKMLNSLRSIYNASKVKNFYLPKIFVRVRSPKQMIKIYDNLALEADILTGFIIPKFSLDTADDYINALIKINENSTKAVYMMPVYESSSIINLMHRTEILYKLKDKLSVVEKLILNIRVGGNDLCHLFGLRRHNNESIHQIRTISNIFSDIITVYGMDYVISGPVWEYYDGDDWREGLIKEINDDKLCGFHGKTVIHPKQISVVNDSYKVSPKDLKDAKSILNWQKDSSTLVDSSFQNERMNEYKTHSNWALQTLFTAEVFGTK